METAITDVIILPDYVIIPNKAISYLLDFKIINIYASQNF